MQRRVAVVNQSTAVNQAYDLLCPRCAALGKTGDKHVIGTGHPVFVYKLKPFRIDRSYQHISPAVVVDPTHGYKSEAASRWDSIRPGTRSGSVRPQPHSLAIPNDGTTFCAAAIRCLSPL